MELLDKIFRRRPESQPAKLYAPQEESGMEVLDRLEAKLSRLHKYEDLLENLPALEELLREILAQPAKDIIDPLVVQESAQFHRGSFWLAAEIVRRLRDTGLELERTSKRLVEERRKNPAGV